VIVLASASAVRARLLTEAGVVFEARPAAIDEAAVKAGLLAAGATPRAVAEHLAEAKAKSIDAGPQDLVIGADQTLELDNQLFDKVGTVAQARERLRQLRGKVHALHAAVVLTRDHQVIWRTTSTPLLAVRRFTDTFLESYLARYGEAALSSVGCYLLEGAGVQLFERIEGDYFAILGLPLIELLATLRSEGALAA
jgi:septum formation protein